MDVEHQPPETAGRDLHRDRAGPVSRRGGWWDVRKRFASQPVKHGVKGFEVLVGFPAAAAIAPFTGTEDLCVPAGIAFA